LHVDASDHGHDEVRTLGLLRSVVTTTPVAFFSRTPHLLAVPEVLEHGPSESRMQAPAQEARK
jgi:hypothetical protein